jgi:hypothetical protein
MSILTAPSREGAVFYFICFSPKYVLEFRTSFSNALLLKVIMLLGMSALVRNSNNIYKKALQERIIQLSLQPIIAGWSSGSSSGS